MPRKHTISPGLGLCLVTDVSRRHRALDEGQTRAPNPSTALNANTPSHPAKVCVFWQGSGAGLMWTVRVLEPHLQRLPITDLPNATIMRRRRRVPAHGESAFHARNRQNTLAATRALPESSCNWRVDCATRPVAGVKASDAPSDRGGRNALRNLSLGRG